MAPKVRSTPENVFDGEYIFGKQRKDVGLCKRDKKMDTKLDVFYTKTNSYPVKIPF